MKLGIFAQTQEADSVETLCLAQLLVTDETLPWLYPPYQMQENLGFILSRASWDNMRRTVKTYSASFHARTVQSAAKIWVQGPFYLIGLETEHPTSSNGKP